MNGQEQTLFSMRAESPRYNRYEARIQAVGRMLDGIREHKVAAALTAAAVVALVLCFLATIGLFIGEASCKDFVYGEEPQCSVKAFLSDVQYQYAPADGEAIWSDTAPTRPGEYRIRAVSKNGFGKPNYSEAMTVTLLSRKLTISIHPASYIYGDFSLDIVKDNTKVEGLATGDRIADLEYDASEDEQGNNTVSVKTVRIVNGAGEDVTACYTVAATEGYFTMRPRPITVSAENAQKVYDGEEWNAGTAELTSGKLAYQDRLHITFSPAPAEAGTYTMMPACTVLNAEGEDVSDCYKITVRSATLTVQKRPISVSTGSASKVYDGKPLTDSQWSVTGGELVEGHTLTGETTGSRTAKGESPNRIKLSVFDAAGTDVSENYDFSVEEGTLTVIPIHLKFETPSAEKVYDGTSLHALSYRLVEGALINGHTLKVTFGLTQVDVGSTANKPGITIKDENGKDVTGVGYTIELDCGTLTVTPRPITVRSGSAEKLYDGMPLTCREFSIIKGSLVSGEYLSPIFTGSQTRVGSSSNYFTADVLGNNKKTFNYDITYVYGTLTVHENPNMPDTGDSESGNNTGSGGGGGSSSGKDPSDGNGIGGPGLPTSVDFPSGIDQILYAQVEGISGLGAGTRIYFRSISYGDYTGSGWEAAEPYTSDQQSMQLLYIGRSLTHSGESPSYLRIKRMEYCPVLLPYYTYWAPNVKNDCYIETGDYSEEFSVHTGYSYSDLKDRSVGQSDANSEAAYRKYVYQEYLQIPETTKKALLEWAEQHGISADSETLVEDIQTAITFSAVYNADGKAYPEGVDVAVYFLTEAKEGICQHFATAATLMYRAFGIPARYTGGLVDTVQNGSVTNLTSRDAHAWVEIYVDGLGWVPMEVTGSTTEGDVKTELHIKAYSATKYYDGENLEAFALEQYSILSGSLREGHRLELSFSTARYATAPGKYLNRIAKCVVYDERGKDVTSEYYNIFLYDGTLEILPRKITVTIGSASKVYDGMPLTCPDYWISQGSLAPGEELVLKLDSVLTNPGRVKNTASEIRIVNTWADTTKNYEITVIPGYLEITEADQN